LSFPALAQPQSAPHAEQTLWKPVEFAILRFNDDAPKSWNIYHGEKRGILLVRLWKRYLLVNVQKEEVYDIDPHTIKPQGNNVEWSLADKPKDPIDISDWKERDIGAMERYRFRFGQTGHYLEIQIPLRPDGKPMY
jgi:hypothetical protein